MGIRDEIQAAVGEAMGDDLLDTVVQWSNYRPTAGTYTPADGSYTPSAGLSESGRGILLGSQSTRGPDAHRVPDGAVDNHDHRLIVLANETDNGFEINDELAIGAVASIVTGVTLDPAQATYTVYIAWAK